MLLTIVGKSVCLAWLGFLNKLANLTDPSSKVQKHVSYRLVFIYLFGYSMHGKKQYHLVHVSKTIQRLPGKHKSRFNIKIEYSATKAIQNDSDVFSINQNLNSLVS